jgi:hypothetical protein
MSDRPDLSQIPIWWWGWHVQIFVNSWYVQIGLAINWTSDTLRIRSSFVQFMHVEKKDNIQYSLRPIILFANIDVSRHILVIDTSVFAKSNMDRRE